MISNETKFEVFRRDRGMCQGCGTTKNLERTPHHCLFKSHYFGKDRDEVWNLVLICIKCHWEIHSGGHKVGKWLREKFERLALSRKGNKE